MSAQPEKVGRYEVVRPIGRGGFALVYLGRDPYINRNLALKVSESKDGTKNKKVLTRLFQEAEAAGALIHPNIVTIYDVGIEEPSCFIAMEYIDGHTLYRHCTPEHLLPIADAIDIIIKVCHGLDYAHQRGIIHRDIKPSNILLGTNGEIKITDFGLASFAELARKDTRTVGTPSYMPPEQVRGKGSTARSDIFSLGVILYQLLCGHKPFDAQTSLEMRHKIVNEPHVPLNTRNPEIPEAFTAVTDRALSKDPDDRYPSALDFARDVERAFKGTAPLTGKLAERVRSLQTLAFFEEFAEEEIAQLMTIGTWLTHRANETIIEENERGTSFFAMISGQAQVRVGNADMGRLARGNCFGEMSFLLGRARSATIIALEECELLRLNPEKIKILPSEIQVKLYRLFSRTLANYLLRADGKE